MALTPLNAQSQAATYSLIKKAINLIVFTSLLFLLAMDSTSGNDKDSIPGRIFLKHLR
jgi:hypothetical protein